MLRLCTPLPIVVSVLLHAAVLACLVRTPAASASAAHCVPEAPETWAGNTFDLDLREPSLAVDAGRGAEAPAVIPTPAAVGEASTPSTRVRATAAAPVPPLAPKRTPTAKKDNVLDDAGAAIAAVRTTRPAPAPRSRARHAGERAETGDAGDGLKKGGRFGAEGPSAARDLGNAFTRAIAPANQADAAWSKLPVGPAGTVDIAIAVDEAGHVGDAEAISKAPSALLLSLAKRTVLLLRGGVFHLKGGEASAGRQVLRLRAEVSDVDAAAVQGGTIDLAFSFSRGKGKAAFTRPGGRHVDVSVTVLRVEAQPAL